MPRSCTMRQLPDGAGKDVVHLSTLLEPRENRERGLAVALVPGSQLGERQRGRRVTLLRPTLDHERILLRRRLGEVKEREQSVDRVHLNEAHRAQPLAT